MRMRQALYRIPGRSGKRLGGGVGDQGSRIPGLPTDAVLVCTYRSSGMDRAVTVYRDRARTTHYLVSKLIESPLVQPIGVENSRIFSYDISQFRTLSAQTLANGLIHFRGTRSPLVHGGGVCKRISLCPADPFPCWFTACAGRTPRTCCC